MEFDLSTRTARVSVGEFSDFTLGPRESTGGGSGVWRAQLGTHWHQQWRLRTAKEDATAQFEVVITGRIVNRGWTFIFQGRIDQLLRTGNSTLVQELKTVTASLPAPERDLRSNYPEYFVQLSTYLTLTQQSSPVAVAGASLRGELIFIEAGTGLSQTVALHAGDQDIFQGQLERVTDFLESRWRARERLRHLHFRSAFPVLRQGQEQTRALLTKAFASHPVLFFEAPTGFGKTGMLLDFALGQLRAGNCTRVIYLTSKATGQLQVRDTLMRMLGGESEASALELSGGSTGPSLGLAAWHVRNKGEHCVNHTFHCVRENCVFLDDLARRWPKSGLARFYQGEPPTPPIQALREAGRAAQICPYEITRAALAFNDFWIGDYNYVFAPNNRNLFYLQAGFNPAQTLLLIDEAHNLPTRVADAYSHVARADDAREVWAELEHQRAPKSLLAAWESWTLLLTSILPTDALEPALEADCASTVRTIAEQLANAALDYPALGSRISDLLWEVPSIAEWTENNTLGKLVWSPRPGEIHFTCTDAASAIGQTLREFGGAVFASATLGPKEVLAESIGLAVSGPETLVQESSPQEPLLLRAETPWRNGVYDVAVDARVLTTYQARAKYYATTAATVAALRETSASPIVVFFPSYAYAEAILRELENSWPGMRAMLQPKLRDLSAQNAWVEEALALSDSLFLVLGSSFAEGIDLLGGRVTHAMVVGPALPEVNAVQRARIEQFRALSSGESFRRVYQVPGITKVNQALGRLVRAPGHYARVILHCRRFLEPSYASLLAPEYQLGENVLDDVGMHQWLHRKFSG